MTTPDITFQVTVDWHATRPLTQADLDRLATLGGAASGRPGDHACSTTFTVTVGADDRDQSLPWETCVAVALTRIDEHVPGRPAGVEILTATEADRRLDQPAPAVLHHTALQILRDLLPPDVALLGDTLETADPTVNGWALNDLETAVIDAALALERT